MGQTQFPLPISTEQLKLNFVGLGDPMKVLSAESGLSIDRIAAQYIRAAQYEVESTLRIPYFLTRFCTREIAFQDGLVQGVDFDLYEEPSDYILSDWWRGTGRTRTHWTPVDIYTPRDNPTVGIARFALTLQATNRFYNVQPEWENIDDYTGEIHIMPYGPGLTGQTVYSLFAVVPIYRAAQNTGVVPKFIHLRYTAGLVEWDPSSPGSYDPLTIPVPTRWDGTFVTAFQVAISQQAAADMLRLITNLIDRGGASISLDGLSESVNPQVLWNRADGLEQLSRAWIQRAKQRDGSLVFAIV